MVQVKGSPSGNWWISYADSEGTVANVDGLRVLCFALYLASIKAHCGKSRSPERMREREKYRRAILSLGVTEQDEIKAKRLTFRQIIFFVDDLWMFPKLVTFWQNGVGLSEPIAANALGGVGEDLQAIFWRWFRRWEGGAVVPFPDRLRRKVRRSPMFQEFTLWVEGLCRPPKRGRPKGRQQKDGLPEFVRFFDEFITAHPDADTRTVIRIMLGLDGSEPMFHVVHKVSDSGLSIQQRSELIGLLTKEIKNQAAMTAEERKRRRDLTRLDEISEPEKCIISSELGEKDKGERVANDRGVRLVERHLKKYRASKSSQR